MGPESEVMSPLRRGAALGSMPRSRLTSITKYGCAGDSPVQSMAIFSPAETDKMSGSPTLLKVHAGAAEAAPAGGTAPLAPKAVSAQTRATTATVMRVQRNRTIIESPFDSICASRYCLRLCTHGE